MGYKLIRAHGYTTHLRWPNKIQPDSITINKKKSVYRKLFIVGDIKLFVDVLNENKSDPSKIYWMCTVNGSFRADLWIEIKSRNENV